MADEAVLSESAGIFHIDKYELPCYNKQVNPNRPVGEDMTDKSTIVRGRVAIVWYVSHDTTPEAPKRALDINTEGGLFKHFEIEVDVEDRDMWVLDVNEDVRLIHFLADGSEVSIVVPGEDLNAAFTPPDGIPANVWARAVYEAHECPDYQGNCCRGIAKKLVESGILR